MTRYVQHISGQGRIWLLYDGEYNDMNHSDWLVDGTTETYHYLPKSEYRLVTPPQAWKDATEAAHLT